MASDKALVMPYTAAEVVRHTIDAEVKRHRPDLDERQYLYVAEQVFMLLCDDTEIALLQQPAERWTPPLVDLYFTSKVEPYLIKLEIKMGRMILYGEDA